MSEQSVLWISSDLDYTMAVRRAFRGAGVTNPMVCLTSNELARSYLLAFHARNEIRALPLLVVVDISHPTLKGFDVLTLIKATPSFANFRVALLGPHDRATIQQAKSLGAAGYAVKPVDLSAVSGLVAAIIENWLPGVLAGGQGDSVESLPTQRHAGVA